MGSCIQRRAVAVDDDDDKTSTDRRHSVYRSVQDEVAAIKSKTAAVKLLLKQAGSREAILKHLNFSRTDLLIYYSYYFELDDLKSLEQDLPAKNTKLSEVIEKYKELKDSFTKIHQEIQDALIMPSTNRTVIEGLIQQAKTEALLRLNTTFEEYRTSSFYKDWMDTEKSSRKS